MEQGGKDDKGGSGGAPRDPLDPALAEVPTKPLPASPHRGRIGHYRLLDLIGEGSFGLVYLAEQTEPVRRRVAVKILKLGLESRQSVARFEAEQQALALMDHANIARVFDAGLTEQNQPYFVMEYVRGVPLNEHCDRARLSVAERLELFVEICAAVQHAHQKGIVHRDLKPSNILIVTQNGQARPKVIDFGVAKTLSAPLTDRTLHTELGQMVGTPEYMSPEQAEFSSQDVDTRSDIYSLGVLLYELLTGTLPLDSDTLRKGGLIEAQRQLREVDPPTPSTRLASLGDTLFATAKSRRSDPRALRRELHGDLDWIVLKALEKDRTRRYQTTTALAADIIRHKRHEPIIARPPSVTYRLHKFIRRHRLGVAAATLIITALLAGLALATFGLVQAHSERNRALEAEAVAKQEAAKARAVSGFLERTLSSADPSQARGKEVTVRELLDDAAREIKTSLQDQPQVLAAVQMTIGASYLALGDHEASSEQLSAALASTRAIYGEEHRDTVLAMVGVAMLRHAQGRFEEAESELRYALTILQRLPDLPAGDLISAQNNLGLVLNDRGKLEEAALILEEASENSIRSRGESHPETLRIKINLARLALGQARLDDADQLTKSTLAKARGSLGDDHPITIYAIGVRAWTLGLLGRAESAEALRREQFAACQAVYGPTHPHTLIASGSLAWLLGDRHKNSEAIVLARQTWNTAKQTLGEEHPDTLETLNTLAVIVSNFGDTTEAGTLYHTLSEARIRVLGEEHPLTLQSLNNLGTFYLGEQDYTSALSVLSRVHEIRLRVSGVDHLETLTVEENLGLALVGVLEHTRAEKKFEHLVEAREKLFGPDHPDTLRARSNLAFAFSSSEQPQRALPIQQEVLASQLRLFGPSHAASVLSAANLATTLTELGRAEEALPISLQALTAARANRDLPTGSLVHLLKARVLGLRAQRQFAEAELLLLEVLDLARTTWGADSATARTAVDELIDLNQVWGRPEQAARWKDTRP